LAVVFWLLGASGSAFSQQPDAGAEVQQPAPEQQPEVAPAGQQPEPSPQQPEVVPTAQQPVPAAPQPPEVIPAGPPPSPFQRGTSMGGLMLGFGTSGDQTVFQFGASYGYFVVNGLAPGLETIVRAASNYPTTLELAPFVRFAPWRHYPVAPILVAKAGRLFVDGLDDLWLAGGGGGLVIFASPHMALTLEYIYVRYFPDTSCVRCDDAYFTGSFGTFF
jgi:hypothetical protein